MDNRPTIPGGWPLRPETPNESPIIPPPLSTLGFQRPVSGTGEVPALSPIDTSQDYTLHSAEEAGFHQARPIGQISIATGKDRPQSRGLLKAPTARTTRSRPFSQATQESTGIYFDAAEGLETVATKDDKKVVMETSESKEGSFTGDGSSTTLTPTQTQGQPEDPPPQRTLKMILMQMMLSNKWNDWWIWEILSCCLTVLSIAAIIITLVLYNGVALKSWPGPMTPNAFMALFITLAQLGMVLPVASSISQLKWIWFKTGERALVDFENFDEASRGPIGGLKLAMALRTKNIVASFGAFIPILSLALAPCLQQLLSYPTKMVATEPPQGGVALAPRSDHFTAYVSQQGAAGLPDMSMRQAVQYGLHNPISETIVPITPSCPTADCTWPSYYSLAVCAQVANVTDLLTVGELAMDTSAAMDAAVTTNVTLPNGVYLEAGQTAMNITSPITFVDGQAVFQANHTLAFSNKPNVMKTTISNSFVIYQKDMDTDTPAYGAVEVLLSWCVNTYNTSVVSAQASTNILSNSMSVSSTDGRLALKADGKEELYTVEPRANFALESYLTAAFSGTYGNEFGPVFSSDTALTISAALYEQTEAVNVTGQALDDMQLQAIMGVSQNVATSMSNNVRGRKSQGTPAIGTAREMQPYIHVSWGWIPYIGNMTFSTCLLLAITIWKTRRTGVDVMKSSALAAMTSLSPEAKAFMGPVDYQGKSWMKGLFLKTQLEKTEGGWSLEARM
ncbi:hypothetical protein BJ875DRAFT_95466 [Amylocarpus encephaloides]|uniref:Uncharacterized protein n=1 Tax=Amylocarpus encephaloides TaxID=45428 RepID=A0A9P7YRW2_9HELO|nr:hypothetical protein BJ875DRAFT_95466 [Amylocarpus encephaloides]